MTNVLMIESCMHGYHYQDVWKLIGEQLQCTQEPGNYMTDMQYMYIERRNSCWSHAEKSINFMHFLRHICRLSFNEIATSYPHCLPPCLLLYFAL